ncbi:hypothetical protein [Candidatus Palibaumannia cicadellinicola]|uniref:Essential cell division protein FtsN n=1 Tax=Candidatus Palibaumannia cicadellinicola TaxID=186490 RepID=A0A0K2BKN8_9GAMM|nr:hypothetical protein [Candidatus Baumannia cicadellinicola]AKZ65757.1 essential cell division protein FtsN [Candidatus Baumannia cicadellinicola]
MIKKDYVYSVKYYSRTRHKKNKNIKYITIILLGLFIVCFSDLYFFRVNNKLEKSVIKKTKNSTTIKDNTNKLELEERWRYISELEKR